MPGRRKKAVTDSPAQGDAAPGATDNGREMSPEERVRARAYELFLERGGQNGNELDDWLRAENEHFR